MIAFTRLGNMGQFGNQLFQYAFLRTAARRLGVNFYCPEWIGDKIFSLHDSPRACSPKPVGIDQVFRESQTDCGFTEESISIRDGTDISGFFQSEKFFYQTKMDVQHWYTFNNSEISNVINKYEFIDFHESVSLSLRLGDDYHQNRDLYPLFPLKYYEDALQLVPHKTHILVFSDHQARAKHFLRKLIRPEFFFIEGNSYLQDFFLITQCHDNIITNSTFSWWGAWLNSHPDKRVIAPKEWFRPGHKKINSHVLCDDWHHICSLHPLWDHYQMCRIRWWIGEKVDQLSKHLSLKQS